MSERASSEARRTHSPVRVVCHEFSLHGKCHRSECKQHYTFICEVRGHPDDPSRTIRKEGRDRSGAKTEPPVYGDEVNVPKENRNGPEIRLPEGELRRSSTGVPERGLRETKFVGFGRRVWKNLTYTTTAIVRARRISLG